MSKGIKRELNLQAWDRILYVMKKHDYTSPSKFAKAIGLKRSENLYQIKRGNNGISKELAARINSRFPDISVAWLLTGEGVYG